MGKRRCFLGIFASFAIAFFTGNVLAEGYTCPDLKQYTSCNAGYYMTKDGAGNECKACPGKSTGGGTVKACTCSTGHSVDGTPTGATTTTATACLPITYSISYTLNGGTKPSTGVPATYTYGVGATVNGVPTRAGYKFAEWCMTGSAGTSCGLTHTISRTDTGNKTFSAKWTPNTFNVKYESGGGTGTAPTAPTSCTYGSTDCKAPNNPYTRNGYRFTGWACTSSSGSCTNSGNYTYNDSISRATTVDGATITLTATWYAEDITVNFAKTGATSGAPSPETITCKYDGVCTAATQGTMLRDGYVFLGWSKTANATTATYSAGKSIKNIVTSGTVTLYPVWGEAKCSVTHGTATPIISGNTVYCSVQCETGYSQKGGSDRTVQFTQNGIAGYTMVAASCAAQCNKLTFNSTTNGGIGGPGSSYVRYKLTGDSDSWYTGETCAASTKTTVAVTPLPTKANNRFLGFYTSTTGTKQCVSATGALGTCAITADTTLYAKYSACRTCVAGTGANCALSVVSNSCTYTTSCQAGYYNLAGDGTYAPSCSQCGANSSTTANNKATTCTCTSPTPAGYSANGTATGGTTSTSGCKAVSYTISYVLNEGTQASTGVPTSYTYGTGATIQGLPHRIGYTFGGWCTDSALANCAGSQTISKTATGNKTFYAKWAPVVYTVTLDNQGATSAGTTAYYYQYQTKGKCYYYTSNALSTCIGGTDGDTITKPTRAGYTFGGYYTGTNGSGTQYVDSTGKAINNLYSTNVGNITLYAKWTACNSTTAGGCGCTSTQHPVNGVCTNCTVSCSSVSGYTLGSYNVCNSQTNSICYRNCTTADVPNSKGTVNGTVTKGGTRTCVPTDCVSGYFLSPSSVCTVLPIGGKECEDGNPGLCCEAGYEKSADGMKCNALKYTVTLDKNLSTATAGTTSVTATFAAAMPTPITKPSHSTQTFTGYFDAKTGGTQYYSATGASMRTWNKPNNATLYAHWGDTPVACEVGKYYDGTSMQACPANFYCPGTGNAYKGSAGCRTACPSSYPKSDGGTSATTEAACYKLSTTACVDPTGGDPKKCPVANSIRCSINTSATVECKQYSGSSTCTPTGDDKCPVDSTDISCSARYYHKDDKCVSCESLEPAGTWLYSNGGNGGSEICYERCDYMCVDSGICTEAQKVEGVAACNYAKESVLGGSHYPKRAETDGCAILSLRCSATFTCDEHADSKVTNNVVNGSGNYCEWKTYTITLNSNGGSGGMAAVYEKYSKGFAGTYAAATSAPTMTRLTSLPTRAKHDFIGYYTAAEGGTKVIEADGTLPSATRFGENTTLYAHWSALSYSCEAGKAVGSDGTNSATCAPGYYCPGGEVSLGEEHGDNGCQRPCPDDVKGGSETSAAGSTAPTACKTVRDNVELADKTGYGQQTCGWNANPTDLTDPYDAACETKVTRCNAGYYRQAENSPTCSSVEIGYYSGADEVAKHSCKDLTGADTTATTARTNSTTATDCYNVCGNLTISNGTRVPNATEVHYNGTRIPACSYTTNCVSGYDPNGAACEPHVSTITLDHNGGTSSTSKIYLKYNTGWYSDKAATAKITSISLPTKSGGFTCHGYLSAGKDVVVDETGKLSTNTKLFTTDATITANWEQNETISCEAGKYYPGSGTTCSVCTAGSYCTGVTTFVDVGSARGIETCASLNGKYTSAKSRDGVSLTTTVTSDAGARDSSDCYATNVEYVPASNTGAGSQTCYYNPATSTYENDCKNETIITCVKGHYLAKSGDIDCSVVGTGYYSADKDLERTACPNLTGANKVDGVTTKSETSEKVTECYLGNIWDSYAHTGIRRSCFHTANAAETDYTKGYSYNCQQTVIVTCDAGYYDDGSYMVTIDGAQKRACAELHNKDKYSPAQSFFTTEPVRPDIEEPGSSTLALDCPETKRIENGTANRVFNTTWTASEYGVCKYANAVCNSNYTKGVNSDGEAFCYFNGECPQGYYCPEDCDPMTEDCSPKKCPADVNGGTVTSNAGSTNITDCYVIYDPYKPFKNGSASVKCNYVPTGSAIGYTNCNTQEVHSCIAGYYYNNGLGCSEVEAHHYSPEGAVNETPCPSVGAGYGTRPGVPADNWDKCFKKCTREDGDKSVCIIGVTHSLTCAAQANEVYATSEAAYAPCLFNITCATGYKETNNGTSEPTCVANEYTVTLNKNGGTGNIAGTDGTADARVKCTFNSGACTLPAVTGLTRDGYTVQTKWCTAANGSGTCYNAGMSITDNLSETGQDMTLYAVWTPKVYTITLRAADAATPANPTTVYLKYATGWFADAAATVPLAKLTTMPTKAGYEFSGYATANKTQIVTSNGNMVVSDSALTFTTANATVDVVWSAGNTRCEAGTYYSGNGTTCLDCTAGNWCPGDSFGTDSGQIGGLNACPDGGKSAAKSDSESDCYKENLATYVAGHGAGTQSCYYDSEAREYSARCWAKAITECSAGYWYDATKVNADAPDCAAVGIGNYSADKELTRTACPNGGTTETATATSIMDCYKENLETYVAQFGTGTQRCKYSSGTGNAAIYDRDCDTKRITKCRAGYWLDAEKVDAAAPDCSEVGIGYYSETDDITRTKCAGEGTTNSPTAGQSAQSCYISDAEYLGTHGKGYQTCYYSSETKDYTFNCAHVTITYCNAGYYLNVAKVANDCIEAGYGWYSPEAAVDRTACPDGQTTDTTTSADVGACYLCPPGDICAPGVHTSCAKETNGEYPLSDAGASDVTMCYRACDKGSNVALTSGRDYYGGENTCRIAACVAGYHLQDGACVKCDEGMYCPGPDDDCPEGEICDTPKSCSSLGDGSWKYSEAGSSSEKDCYKKCEAYEIKGGMAIPASERAYYANQCEYKGRDHDGNPCDIIDGVCVVNSCKSSYEMNADGRCVPCNRENALTYKEEGNCIVATCRKGYHPMGKECVADVKECSAPNATIAEVAWNYKTNAWGGCIIKECEDGYHISANACTADIQDCTVEHGRGQREWNHTTNAWGECEVTYCDAGYTSDRYESNEPTKPCGNCKNKYSIEGELVARTYSRGCEISSCMYAGERYVLDGNECRPICNRTDETGKEVWNPKTQRCERTCNEGFTAW